MKQLIKKIIPRSLRNLRHFFYAWWGAVRYGYPSDELFVIGITGTSGKSSTTAFLRQVLEQAGFTVGSLSTVDFYVAGETKLNDQKMTMLGKMQIQHYLREMVNKQCDIAIVETTSEGRLQHRHRFINYDVMMLTNLYPEHIESHGSYEKYKQAKKDIFTYVSTGKRKKLANQKIKILGEWEDIIPKIALVNADIPESAEFLSSCFDERYGFGITADGIDTFTAHDREISKSGLRFTVFGPLEGELGIDFHAPIFGEYNTMNVLSVIALGRIIGIDWKQLQHAVTKLVGVPGRVEFIHEAKERGFDVIVDYAFEPVAMKALYKVVRLFKPKRIIHVFGSTGGGRDVSRRFSVGEYVGKKADICIITDEDPYDDDPEQIIGDVVTAVAGAGKEKGKTLFVEIDRRKAIDMAIHMAMPGDMVLVTGKGSEQAMVVKGKLVPWDDRAEVRNALAKM